MPTVDRSIAVLVEGGWVHRVKIGGAYGFGVNKHVAWVGQLKDAEHAVLRQLSLPAGRNRTNSP